MTFPQGKGVLIGPPCRERQHIRDGQPNPRGAPIQHCQHIIPDLVFNMPWWGIPPARRPGDMSHRLWTVACDHHTVMGTHWRHTLQASPSACPRVWCLHVWNSLGKDAHCCWVNGAGLPKVMCSPSTAHCHATIRWPRKYWRPSWCTRLVRQFRVCMPLLYLLWWIWRVWGTMTATEWDSSGSLQILGSQLPACFVQQLADAHVPSPVLHGSRSPSFEFVTPIDCCAPTLRSWGDGSIAAYPTCGDFCGCAGGEVVAIKILCKKLVGATQTVLATCAETWVVGHVLENYTCLSSGRDLYVADFGDSYGNQTVLVGDCESLCDLE